MATTNKINFEVGYTVDKSGLTEIQNALKQVQEAAKSADLTGTLTPELKKASDEAQKLGAIFNEAWNSKLNQLDLTKLNTSITNTYGSMSQLKTIMEASGTTGAAAYNKMASSILSTNLQIKQSSKLLDDMAKTMTNTVKWGVASSAMNSFTGAVQSAWSYIQKLDTSLNDIRIVTEKSAEDMAEFAEYASSAAKSLGASTTDYTNASLIYYQQGLSDEEVQERAEVTLKAANVTGQAASEVSEQLTAVWNGFGFTTEEAEQAVDVLAAVAASTASDLEELSTGMSKVASAASAMGVGEEQLAAQLSTIISVTRQAPESVGTALKTIYARMSDIEAGVDEDGATLGSYTAEMAEMGINVLDTTGSLRDMGDVIEEIGTKWADFSREQQVALAQTMAGTRQYNNLIALFDNWDEYLDALEVANDATGTLQEQQDIYMESIAAHLEQLSTAWEEVYNTIADTEAINKVIDGLTSAVEVLGKFLDSLGGGMNTLAMLGVMGVNVFNSQIGGAIEKQITNSQILKQNEEALATVENTANLGVALEDNSKVNKIYDAQITKQKELLNISEQIGTEEYNRLTTLNQQITSLSLAIAKYEDIGEKDLYGNALDDLEQINADLNNATILEKELNNEVSEYLEIISTSNNNDITNRQDEVEYLSTCITLQEFLNTLDENDRLTQEQKAQIKETYNKLSNENISLEDGLNTILAGQSKEIDNLNEKRKQTLNIVKELEKYDEKDITAIKSQKTTLEKMYQEGGFDENGVFQEGLNSKQQQKVISSTIQGLSSLVIGINSVTNAVKVLTNEDLSSWEKFSQIASNLVFTLPMMIKSFEAVGSLMPNLAVAIGAVGTTTEVSFLEATGAVLTFETALGPVWLLILAISAAIATTTVIVKKYTNALNAQAKAAEEAAEAANDLAEANDELIESYETLQSAIEAYDSAKDQLDECTKGTEEWKEALDSTTSSAKELIDLISELDNINLSDYGTIYNTSTGEFNQDLLDAVEEQYIRQIAASSQASAQTDYNASISSARSDLLDSIRDSSDSWYDEEIQSTIIDNIDELVNLSNEELTKELDKLGFKDQIDDIDSLNDAINNFASEMENATITLEALTKINVTDVLGDDYENDVIQLATNMMLSEQEEIADKYVEDWAEQLGQLNGGGNETYQEIVKQLQALGLDYDAVSGQKAVKGNDENRKFTFKDSDGNTFERSAEEIADILAAEDASNNIEEYAAIIQSALDTLESNVSEGIYEGIDNYINNGNFESMTQSELDSLFSELKIKEASELTSEAITEYLKETMGLSEEELTNIFGEGYAENIINSLTDTETALNSYLDNLSNSTKEAFNNLNISDEVSVASGEYIADVVKGAIKYGTEDTLNTLSDTFDKVDNVNDFALAIEDIDDWSSITANDLLDILDEADVETDLTTTDLQAFVLAMRETGEVTLDTVEALQETYATLQDIIDGLETGDTIDSEDYKTLIDSVGDYGDLVSTYFTEMLDGTFKLTGDAKNFAEIVNSIEIAQFQDKQNELIADNLEYQELLNTDWSQTQKAIQEALLNSIQDLQNLQGINVSDFDNVLDNYNNTKALTANSDPSALGDYLNSTLDFSSLNNYLDLISQYEDLTDNIVLGDELDDIEKYQKALENGELDISQVEEISSAIDDIVEDSENWQSVMEENEEEIQKIDFVIAESCESYDELKQTLDEGIISVEAFNKVYNELWAAERTEDLDSDEIEEYTEYIQDLAETSEDFADSLADDAEASEDLAVQIMNMNDAVEDLSENWENWSDILANSTKESEEYAEALSGTISAMSKLLDIDDEFISDDLVLNNMEDIALAAQGDADAIDRLRAAAYDSIVIELDLDDESLYTDLQYDLNDIQSFLDNNLLEVGSTIAVDDAGASAFIDSLNGLIDAAALTSDEVQALMTSMGYNVEFEPAEIETASTYPLTTTYHTREITGYDDKDNPISWIDTETSKVENVDNKTIEEAVGTKITTEGGESAGGEVTTGATTTTSLSSGSTSTSSHVSSITKIASGSANNYSAANAGGDSLTDDEEDVDEPEILDYLEDEADRYHDINLRLKAISTTLSRLQNQEDKLLGQNLIDNLNEQLATLNDQIDATNVKIKIAQQEAAEYQADLASQGVTFNADGYITNYADIMASKLAYVNSAIANYNAMTAEEQEEYQDTLDAIEEEYDDFVQKISDYDTLISETIPGLEDDIQEALDKEIEIQITKFTMEVEIRLDMEEAEKDWNEFYRKVILGIADDDILGGAMQSYADALSYYNTAGTGTGSIQTLTAQLNNTLDQLKQLEETGTSSVYGDDQSQALEDLQTYYTELMSQLEDFEDLADDIEESYLDMIDEATEAFDEHLEQYEYMNDLLEHDMEVVKLMYGDEAYSKLSVYYQKIEDNNNAQLAFLRQRVDYAYEMMQAETDPEAQQAWLEEWEDALSELNDSVEDALDNIVDKYVNTIDEIIEELNDAVTNGLGLDYVSDEWDLMNQKADIYLDEINAIYEVESLQAKWQEAIDSTDDIAQQKQLNELMEEQINYLTEKGELTDYDIERAELEYEIALKQLQLQEAQQNTSSMRLRRDSSGNYKYEYVSDEDAIADAQSELLALQNQLYNLDVEAYENNLNEIYDAYNEFQEKLKALYEDQTLSDEERAEQEALIMEYYGDIINSLTEENAYIRTNLNESAFDSLAALYATDSDLFSSMTNINMESYQNMVSAFKNLNAESLSDFNSMTTEQLDFVASLTDEQLSLIANMTDEQLDSIANMTTEELSEFLNLTDEQVDLLTRMTEDEYSLIEGLTDDEINFLSNLTETERQQFADMTDEQRESFYNFATDTSDNYASMTEAMKGYLSSLNDETQDTILSSMVPVWESGVQEMADTFGENGMEGVCEDALNKLSQATKDYQDDVDELSDAAGVDLKSVAKGYDNVENQIQDVVDAEDDVIDSYDDEITAIKNVMKQLDNLIDTYKDAEKAAKNATTAAYNYWQQAQSANATAANTASTASAAASTASAAASTASVAANTASTAASAASAAASTAATNTSTLAQYISTLQDLKNTAATISGTYGTTDTTAKTIASTSTNFYAVAFDTGGYTGEWNSNTSSDDGALAILHQKELVLNQDDTANLLNAVSIVSDIAGLLNNLNTSMFSSISGLLNDLGEINISSGIGTNDNEDNIVQQDVHIEATFGDSTANEIETALNNLINSAAQYANKKGI